MSSLQERKFYLQLWSFTTGPAIDVMKHYFEVKVLNTSNFQSYLNDLNNMHTMFHQCFPTTPCCKCATASLAAPNKKGCLNHGQFDQLYDGSGPLQPSHIIRKGNKVNQLCLCKYSAKSSVTVNDLDIILFNDIVQHCCPSKLNSVWRLSIKDVRNFLAHAGTGCVNKQDFEDKWKTLSTATLGFAGELGKVCEKMFQTEIVRIKNCSTDELKEMLENSAENQAKMLNLLNGFKPTVDECKKTAELIHIKQESHDKQFENIQSAIGQSTSNYGEIMHKLNNMESYMKLIVEEKGKKTSDGKKRIKIETQVDNSSWNEENTAKRLCKMSNADIVEESADKEKFYITNVENKCLQIELVAFPDVFKSPQSLRKAIKILIDQLIDAGEVDTSIPGRMDIEFTIKTPLTKDEMDVAFSVFGCQDNLDESTENGLDLKPKLQDHISVSQTVTTETKRSDNSDSEMDFRPIDEQFVTVKPESISARYDEFFITVENVKCLLKITGLPENVEVLDGTVQALDNKGNNTYNVELILECPKTWNDEDVYANLNSNLSKLHGYFHIDLLEQPSDGKITLQTTVEENVFLSKTSLELAFQQLLSRIRTVCNLQSSTYEELSVTAAVLSVSYQRGLEDEKKTIKEELKKSPITTEDNNVKCQFCKKEFECYKCTAKIEHIRTLSLTNRMKEQTISRLEKTSLQMEKEITEEPQQKKRNTGIISPLKMPEEPQQKKRKTEITSPLEMPEGKKETVNRKDNKLVVDMKHALQKLGEIPLIDYEIQQLKKHMQNINEKWFTSTRSRSISKNKPKRIQTILDNLLKEKSRRTELFVDLKDIVHNQSDFITESQAYYTDIGFLDIKVQATNTHCDHCSNCEESQISSYCETCDIFLCDTCIQKHRVSEKRHEYVVRSNILRQYKLQKAWDDLDEGIIDIKCFTDNTTVILKTNFNDNKCIIASYDFEGVFKNECVIPSKDMNSKIALIDDTMVAITVPISHLIHIATVKTLIDKTDIQTPAGTTMTGGIECTRKILYVAFSDAIRVMNLSGQIQTSINIPNVNILSNINNNRMICVHSKYYLNRTVSCIDLSHNVVSGFGNFPFHPDNITTDNVGNIVFRADGAIWETDRDGKNFKVIISPHGHFCTFKGLSYNVLFDTLITVNSWKNQVLLYKRQPS